MQKSETVKLSLPSDLVDELRAAVSGGDYGNLNDAVRDALDDWRVRRRGETGAMVDLRQLVQEGIDSGPGLDADAMFAQLRGRFPSTPPK
jgi:antitoxin ParD1/3/4